MQHSGNFSRQILWRKLSATSWFRKTKCIYSIVAGLGIVTRNRYGHFDLDSCRWSVKSISNLLVVASNLMLLVLFVWNSVQLGSQSTLSIYVGLSKLIQHRHYILPLVATRVIRSFDCGTIVQSTSTYLHQSKFIGMTYIIDQAKATTIYLYQYSKTC